MINEINIIFIEFIKQVINGIGWFLHALNQNQGLIALLALGVSIYSIIVMLRISKITTSISNEFVDKKKISEYLDMKLFNFPLINDKKEEIYVKTLNDLKRYTDMGYFALYQSSINANMYGDALLRFIDLIQAAKTNGYKPTNASFSNIIKSLPATELDINNDRYIRRFRIPSVLTIGRYVKKHKIDIENDNGTITFIMDKNCVGLKGAPRTEFRQLYRADFSGNNREEVLFLEIYDGGGTMSVCNLRGVYYGRRHWFSLRKRWNFLDIYAIEPDVFFNPFKR